MSLHRLRFSRFLLLATVAAAISTPAFAELQLSLYGGANSDLDSHVTTKQGTVDDSRDVSWDGKSFKPSPYYGWRVGYWLEPNVSGWGFALDATHTKAYSEFDKNTDPTYEQLKFTHGNNLFTANAMYRYKPDQTQWELYGGGGAGVAVPYVIESLKAYPSDSTSEYQLAGPAAQLFAGTRYNFTDHWSTFAEGKFSYSHLYTDLDGGGHTETNIWSPQVALGVSYSF